MAKRNLILSLKDCSFKVQEDKLGTGRVVAWDEFSTANSFTFESSYYGYKNAEGIIVRLLKEDYMKLGEDFSISLLEFYIISKQLERDLIKSNGWLRPKKLLDITGETA